MSDGKMSRDEAMGLVPWGEWRTLVDRYISDRSSSWRTGFEMMLLLYRMPAEAQGVMMHYAHGVVGWPWQQWAITSSDLLRVTTELDGILCKEGGGYLRCVQLLCLLCFGVSYDGDREPSPEIVEELQSEWMAPCIGEIRAFLSPGERWKRELMEVVEDYRLLRVEREQRDAILTNQLTHATVVGGATISMMVDGERVEFPLVDATLTWGVRGGEAEGDNEITIEYT